MRLSRSIVSFAAIASVAFADTVLADSMTFNSGDVNKSVTLNYNGFSSSGGTTIGGLTGSTTFTLTGVAGNTYNFEYSVTNTSSSPVTGSRISSFAFDTDPTIASATSTGAFSQTTLNSNYPNGIGEVDVCFKDATTGSCAGGGGGGLRLGESGAGAFSLTFSSPATAVTLSEFFVRYQSIAGIPGISSANGRGTIASTSSTTTGGTAVPEPDMLGLFGLGLAGLALARRRQVLRRA